MISNLHITSFLLSFLFPQIYLGNHSENFGKYVRKAGNLVVFKISGRRLSEAEGLSSENGTFLPGRMFKSRLSLKKSIIRITLFGYIHVTFNKIRGQIGYDTTVRNFLKKLFNLLTSLTILPKPCRTLRLIHLVLRPIPVRVDA